MLSNVLEQAKSYFNNEVINKASTQLNESESSLTKAIELILPKVMGWINSKANTTDGAAQVLDLAKNQESVGVLDPIEHLIQSDVAQDPMRAGQSAISDVFGESHQSEIDELAEKSGVKPSSIASLLSLAIPTILGIIGKHLKNGDFTLANMAGFLGGANTVMDIVPENVEPQKVVVAETVPIPPVNPEHPGQKLIEAPAKSSNGWLWILLLLLIGFGVWWFFFKDKKAMDNGKVVSDTTVITKRVATGTVDSIGNFIYDEGDSVVLTLPGSGEKLTVGQYSTEAQLIAFLNDDNQKIDTVNGNWYEFTNVHFKLNSSDLTEVSNRQLNNIVTISKAFPNAKFKFGGYTDTTGDMAVNLPLSQKRAEVISALVERLGADKNAIVDATGYGAQFPVASNETPEGRAQNRRVAIGVKAK